jgi:hypothetical protein
VVPPPVQFGLVSVEEQGYLLQELSVMWLLLLLLLLF